MPSTAAISALLLPAPPVLHPSAAAGAAPELEDLRRLSVLSLEKLLGECDHCIVICKGPQPARYRATASGDLRQFGVMNAHGRLPEGWRIDDSLFAELPLVAELPAPLVIFSWLMHRVSPRSARPPSLCLLQVPTATEARALASHFYSRSSVSPPHRLALVVLGELSARRGCKEYASLSPTPEAQIFDEALAKAWSTGDQESLRQLLNRHEEDLVVSAGAPLQFLLEVMALHKATGSGETVQLLSPYGVTYFLAHMRARPQAQASHSGQQEGDE